VAVAALTFALGGHWAILQSVAWVTMVAGYSQAEPLKDALVKTFDGRHPCRLCKLVREGKASEQKQELQKLVLKIDFFLQAQPSLLSSPPPFPQPVSRESSSRQRLETPPTPPPRQLPT
jgi:hypothetical protein